MAMVHQQGLSGADKGQTCICVSMQDKHYQGEKEVKISPLL